MMCKGMGHLMTYYGCQFVIRGSEFKQTGVDHDLAAWETKSIDLVGLDYAEIPIVGVIVDIKVDFFLQGPNHGRLLDPLANVAHALYFGRTRGQ
jgi:hypothetical protein